MNLEYRSFRIYKGRGKYRNIQAPNDELKSYQRSILADLYKVKVHSAASGFIPKVSIKDNALKHLDNAYVFTLDLKDFFDTITYDMVLNALMNNKVEGAEEISKYCTHNGNLVQGAPTSPVLSNIVFKPIDRKIDRWCKENNLVYSRYADDVTISGEWNDIAKIKIKVISLLNKKGFKISYGKVATLGKHRQQNVTGIVVNQGISVPRKQVNRIRALIHNMESGKMNLDKIDEVLGYTSFMISCDPKYKKYYEKAINLSKKA